MSNILLTAAAAAIILAVVGGGAKAFGVEVPVIASRRRQAGLALVGVAFFAAAVLLRDDSGDGGTSKQVQAYRQHVLAACRGLEQVGGTPPLNSDLTVDRDRFLEWARAQLATSEGILSALWERPVPNDLKDERKQARRDAGDLSRRTKAGFSRLEETVPDRFSLFPNPPPALQRFSAELAAPSTRFEASMSELAGEACRPPQPAGTSGTG
jgi:hypothetical protein